MCKFTHIGSRPKKIYYTQVGKNDVASTITNWFRMIIFLWQPFPFYEDIRNATRHSLIDFPNLHILYQIKLLSREVEDY